MRCLEILVEIDHVAVQAGNGKMTHARQPENPVLRIIKSFSNKPDGWLDLRDIDRHFDVSEQEQGPKRGFEIRRVIQILRALTGLFLIESTPERAVLFFKSLFDGVLSDICNLSAHGLVLHFAPNVAAPRDGG